MTKKSLVIVILTLVLLGLLIARKGCAPTYTNNPVPTIPSITPTRPAAVVPSPVPSPTPVVPEKKAVKIPVKKNSPPTEMTAPPVELHKELIPKNVEIVRVYYAEPIAAPGKSIEFDINGSGFDSEFKKLIRVESGHDNVLIKNLELKTPNQIHGVLVISATAETKVSFPRVLINDKVVFQAPEPFAVIREGDVLNLIFTEMGESGRTGRFRVFTNLTEKMFEDLQVKASTPSIQIGNLKQTPPFLIDGEIVIGTAIGGDYGLRVSLKDKTLWNRDGIIRVVKPNVGQSGLVQRVLAMEEFHRPGDRLQFALQGSGFRPEDTALLSVRVKGLDVKNSTFVFVAPGRMELSFELPNDAAVGSYGLAISQGSEVLLETPKSFTVVQKNWLRGFRLNPPLKAGQNGKIVLAGRDLDKDYIERLKVEVDEPSLKIEAFVWKTSDEAEANIQVGPGVKPGDYLVHLASDGAAVSTQFGNIIRIEN